MTVGVTSPDPRNIIGHVPGRLVVAPSSLTADFPHGGVSLGIVEDAVLIREAPKQILTAEEHGNEPYEVIYGGEAWSLACFLREWNLAAWSRVFSTSSAGGVSGQPKVESPGTLRAGARLSDRAVVLLFSPVNLDLHPCVVFYKAVPMLEDTARLNLRVGGTADRLRVPAIFVGIRDASGRTLFAGARKDGAL